MQTSPEVLQDIAVDSLGVQTGTTGPDHCPRDTKPVTDRGDRFQELWKSTGQGNMIFPLKDLSRLNFFGRMQRKDQKAKLLKLRLGRLTGYPLKGFHSHTLGNHTGRHLRTLLYSWESPPHARQQGMFQTHFPGAQATAESFPLWCETEGTRTRKHTVVLT